MTPASEYVLSTHQITHIDANLTSTGSEGPTSPLLRLPAELRNQIYGYVLGGNTVDVNYWSRQQTGPHYLGLLLANRQLHRETALGPYATSTFLVFSTLCLISFLDCRSQKQLGAITALCIRIHRGMLYEHQWPEQIDKAFAFLARIPRIQQIEFLESDRAALTTSEKMMSEMAVRRSWTRLAQSIRVWSPSVRIVVKANEYLEHDIVMDV
jgi:hypothetical protein